MYNGTKLRRTVLGRHAASGATSDVREVVVTDADLAARFAIGDAAAVRALYQRYGELVYAVAHKVLGDITLAEDATQQTFVQAWGAAGTFDPTRALGPWLATIARRAAIDLFRRERRHRSHVNLDVADGALVSQPPSAEQISDIGQVRQALQHLTETDRELIRLQHYGELTHTEIARRLAVPLGTVKSRSYRAHRRLAELLNPHFSADMADASSGMANVAAC
jgi:RNA polymerase sigma-70 factor (ECF subfamily)